MQGEDKVGAGVLRAVDLGADRVGGHGLAVIGHEQLLQSLLGCIRIQPERVIVRINDHRHPAVDLLRRVIRRGRDDSAGLDDFIPHPVLPQSGEREHFLTRNLDVVRLFGFRSGGHPFVVAGSGYQAAVLLERGAEGRLLGEGFADGVDHAVADFLILGPVRDQAPMHRGQDSALRFMRKSYYGDILRGRDVVPGSVRLDFVLKCIVLEYYVERGGECVATAHRSSIHLHQQSVATMSNKGECIFTANLSPFRCCDY